MKGMVEMIQADDDRDVLKLTRQRDLRGGGNVSSTHDERVDFNDINSIKALSAAWAKFARGKTSRTDVMEYKSQLKKRIERLHHALVSERYRHGYYQRFTICDPKTRHIHKATVEDRLVHQAIVSAIEPVFEKRFIYDSYSCRQGKGTHAGVRRLHQFLRQASRNDTQKVYVLKCDVKQFFASIDHELLMEQLAARLDDERVLWLLREILLSHGADIGKGIPLGNVTSQLFANVYLHELDWYIKQRLGVQWYARYCDDFVIVHTDEAYLLGLIGLIRTFLREALRLELHPDKVTIRSWRQGVDFLGFVLRPHATTLRTKTKRRMMAKVSAKNLSSYIGICSHANAYHIEQVVRLAAWEREVLS